MKRNLLTAGVLALAVVTSGAAFADDDNNGPHHGPVNAASATGGTFLVVYVPLTVTQTTGLDFGTITSGQAGVVTIAQANGARTVSGGVGAVAADAGAAGAFAVSGQPYAAINVLVAPQILGMQNITGATITGALPTALNGATAAFTVGGSLQIPANTPAGVYKGFYAVTVNYP